MNQTKQLDFRRLRTAMIARIVVLCSLSVLCAFGQKPESGKLFAGRDATIYYEVRGPKTGVPLFVLNGGPGVDHTYMHSGTALDVLAKKRPVIFYDPRGVGKSPALKKGQSCTFDDQVNDLEALRSFLGYERIDVLGHSFGGSVAMAYAVRFPARVGHLALSDSVAPKLSDWIYLFAQVFPETNERMEATDKRMHDGAKGEMKAYMMDYLSMIFYSPAKRDAYLAKVTNPAVNQQIQDGILKGLENVDLNPEIAKFRFPVLVMTGRFDMNVAPVVAYNMHKTMPNSKFVVFDTSGHMPFYEEPEKFVRTMNEFLAVKPPGK